MSADTVPVCSDDSCSIPSKPSFSDQISLNHVSSTKKPIITIDIISDNVCPWCFVGKRRLEKAMEKVPKDAAEFHIRWHPYQLEPDAPEKSVPKIDRYRQKFGSNVERMLHNMIEVGRGVGINFQYTNNGRIGNTLNSHRLVEFAYEKGGEALQNKMINVLFNAYFELERDISDKQVLIDLAVRAGIDKKEAEEFLESDRYEKEIQQSLFNNFQNNVTGVPHFTFNNKYQISGGQEPAVFLSIFKRLGVKL